MRAIALVSWLAVGAGAWLPTVDVSTSSNDTINTDGTNQTVKVANYVDLNACSCNRVNMVCDYLCCCDTFCNQDVVAQWRKNSLCQTEFVDSMKSFFCDETILAFTPRLREMNTCNLTSYSITLPQHLLYRIQQCRYGQKCI